MNRVVIPTCQSRKLKSRYGARNRFQEEKSLEWSSQITKAGRYDNHMNMPTWFLAPIAGLMLPTQTTYASGIDFYVSEQISHNESIPWKPCVLKSLKIRALALYIFDNDVE